MKSLLLVCVAFLTTSAYGSPVTKSKPIMLPVIGNMLGADAKQFSRRILHDDAKFKERMGDSAASSNDFILDFPGTKSVEVTITDGRIAKIVAHVFPPSAANAEKFDKSLAITDLRAKVTKERSDYKKYPTLIKLTFEVVPVEVYIADTSPKPEICEGLRRGEWVAGMSEEDQRIANDGPGTYKVTIVEESNPIRAGQIQGVSIDPTLVNVSARPMKIFTTKAAGRDDAKKQAAKEAVLRGEVIESVKFTSK